MENGYYLEEALDNIDIQSLMPRLEKLGFKEKSVKKAFIRGSISKELAPALEDLTSISVNFWLFPDRYLQNGKRRLKRSPSSFIKHPWNSVLQNNESEIVARNIMVVLKKTGDVFRPLSWEEYAKARINDGNFSENEKPFFEKVVRYCESEDSAALFSQTWATD